MIKINKLMPQCCDDCFAFDDRGDYPYCLISQYSTGYTFDSAKRRMNNCPLIEEETVPDARCMANPEMKISRYYGENKGTFYCPICRTILHWHAPNCYSCGATLNWNALTIDS